MGWNINTRQLTDAALDFASAEPIVQRWTAQVAGTSLRYRPARLHSVYGQDGILAGFHNRLFDSDEDMFIALAENTGGRVPVDMLRAIISGASQAEARARSVARVAEAVRDLEQGLGGAVGLKPLREAMYFWWSRPRLLGMPMYRGKYPLTIPWSADADAARRAGQSGLVLEHIVPVAIAARGLIESCDERDRFVARLLEEEFRVITREEDEAIASFGHRSSIPASGDPMHRYVGVVREWVLPV